MTTYRLTQRADLMASIFSVCLVLFSPKIHAESPSVSPAATSSAIIGGEAPLFEGINETGERLALKSLKGKYVVLEWFNDGCPFILKHYESNNMQKLQKKWTQKGVIWLSVLSSAPGKQGHLSPDELSKLDKKWKSFRTHALFDSEGKIGRLYGATTTPHMFIIAPDGRLIYKGAIDDNPSSRPEVIATSKNYVEAALTEHQTGQKVSKPETQPYGCSVKYANK